ncbi:MAG: VOC family protein [Cyclobacteriaceae bacterium]
MTKNKFSFSSIFMLMLFSTVLSSFETRQSSELGTFSLSLSVKDVAQSKQFYETIGFKQVDGNVAQNWVIMSDGNARIGLSQGFFQKNTITFNPNDVRNIQKELKAKGISFALEVEETSSGPGTAMIIDPDGNPILLDQR